MKRDLISMAIMFATEKHDGQKRKGTDLPYIVHPVEVGMWLQWCKPDNAELISAGILHDVVEDTEATLTDVKKDFGFKVQSLVASNSEDKSKSWVERKTHTIESVIDKTDEELLLLFADKYCNLKSLYFDYQNVGDELWSRFNKGKEPQMWYYTTLYEKFSQYNTEKHAILPVASLVKYRVFLESVFDYNK